MHYKPCDELKADLAAAQFKWDCELEIPAAERLIGFVTKNYSVCAFETLLEWALDVELVVDDTERHAYKHALGLFFNKRAQYARQQSKERDAIPFAPR